MVGIVETITSLIVPLETEVFVTPEKPVIGMVVDIDMPTLHELISITGHPFGLSESSSHSHPKAVELAKMDLYMRNTIEREVFWGASLCGSPTVK
jgi:hypothetical protein